MIWSENITEDFIISNIDKLNDEQLNDLVKFRKLSTKTINSILEKYK